jgi:hypothetical protein
VATSDGDRDETLILTCPWPESPVRLRKHLVGAL